MVTKSLRRKQKLIIGNGYVSKNPIELNYYLLESSLSYDNEFAGEKVYGIGIVKRVNETCFEEKNVRNFSFCINETKELIDKLADNTVTPVSLRFVLDDLLGT